MNKKRLMTSGLVGAALIALCCFTPILVGLLGLVGLGAVTGYVDYVLLPTLAGFLGLALYGLSRRDRENIAGCCASHSVNDHETGRVTKP